MDARPQRLIPWLLGSAIALTAAPAARAEDAGTAARIEALERALEQQRAVTARLREDLERNRALQGPTSFPSSAEIAASLDAYLAANRPVAAAPSLHRVGGTGLRWGGYASLEFVDRSDSHSRFDLHRLILSADAEIADRVDFATEVEIEHGGVSDEFSGEIVLERADVTFHVSDLVNPRLGWIWPAFGRSNLFHDDPLWDFTLRPFTARFLVPTGFGQPGVGVAGAAPFGCGHVFSYDLTVTNGFRDAFTADEGVREARQDRDNNDGKQVWGRVAVAWDAGCVLDALETGVSGTWGIYDDDDENEISGFAADLFARKGPFEFHGEYVAYDYERDAADPPDAVRGQDALWLEAAWHFFPGPCSGRECPPFVRDTSLFTLAFRYERMDLDDRVSGAAFEDDLESVAVALGYRIAERTVFRVDHTWYFPEEGTDVTQWTASFSTYF